MSHGDRVVPAHLLALVATYCLASLLHFAHNAEHVAAYPNLPAWITRESVYLAWLAITALGAAGVLLAWRGWRVAGALVLAVYGALGLDGLAHYALAPHSAHTAAMNATIVFEGMAGVVLAIAAMRWAVVGRRGAAA